MPSFYEETQEAAAYIKDQVKNQDGRAPRAGMLTGTGLGGIADAIEARVALPYAQIPHFPLSTVQSHAGRLILGRFKNVPVCCLQGRFHLYEGYRPGEVVFPVRVMAALGVKTLIITNAAGGLNLAFNTGDIMLITDHLNLTGENPLVGPNHEDWGPRFPDMAAAYDHDLARLALKTAEQAHINLQQGVYAGLKGPSLETPAENRYLGGIGADAVGFSTVQETIAAVHLGLRVLGLATITNINDPDRPAPARLDDIIAAAIAAEPKVTAVIGGVLGGL